MTGARIPHPDHTGTHRQKGTPVADDRAPHALPDTPADTVSAAAENAVDGPTQRIPRVVIDTLDTATTSAGVIDDAGRELAVSVWTTAQTAPAAQRKNRYVAE
ncbi:MAG: site-specific DNA-methyltransferase, partial [Kutzneria sp.]|nr:site-specific DNA-methyltransferase [Kutzneria sp.]